MAAHEQEYYDVIVIGGGPAGLAAALAARKNGAERVLIVERDASLGGILNQCIHAGFGLEYFGEELTGPEYAGRFLDMLPGSGIEIAPDTMVLEVTRDRRVRTMSAKEGVRERSAGSVVLAMGCRERTRGAVSIPGDRPAGIFTAGAAQRMINMNGWAVGRKVIILGSGDIGLIMARRLVLEGAEVVACLEIMPYSSGLRRNIVQCLEDFDIPLLLSCTVTNIEGRGRVERITAAMVDGNRRPIPGSEFELDCDTLLLSVGLIPENELSRQAGIEIDPRTKGPVVDNHMETSVPGIFACGNALHVHDLADDVTRESERAGRFAAESSKIRQDPEFVVQPGDGVSYTVPQRILGRDEDVEVMFRVNRPHEYGTITVRDGKHTIARLSRSSLAPGEMQKIRIPVKSLAGAEGPELTVSVK